MHDDAPIRKTLKTVLAALESQDWPWAVAELGALEYCTSPEEIVADPWTAITIAQAAWLAPCECLTELQILAWDGEDQAYLRMDAERVPTVIADKLFAAAERRFRQLEDEAEWDQLPRYAELLLELPGASDAREQVLLDLFAGLIDRANALSLEVARSKKRPARVLERDRFTAVWNVMGLAAQSSAYDMSLSLLSGLLRGAERPMLAACDAGTELLLWTDLVAVWELRGKHNLRSAAGEWLHRTVCQDEPDEHAASELEEP